MGGSKKKNGHRKACQCPICKNMKNSKKRGGSKSRKTKRRRGGDNDETDTSDDENNFSNDETDTSDEEDELGEEEEQEQENIEEDKNGGRRKKKGNGHKVNCKCPICKNMRKKRGGDNDEQPDVENQIGDLEEAGIKATTGSDLQDNETKASTNDYDALDAAEKGEAGQNVVGGTRKRRRGGKKKWGGKTRKSRKSRRRH